MTQTTTRQLKFQAFDEQTGQMSEPFGLGDIGEMDEGVTGILMPDNRWYRLDRLTIRQFTGLLDKSGVEIYEGDVITGVPVNGWVARVSFKGTAKSKFLVRWDLDGFVWESIGADRRYLHETDLLTWHKDAFHHDGVLIEEKEVIGNIYQHPNLIEEKR